MAKELRDYINIARKLIQYFTPGIARRNLIGQDFFGTKYYEEALGITSKRRRPARYFIPVNKNDHTQELPAEWESWLRYRRTDPPTDEEVMKNHEIALTKKRNAAALEAKQKQLESTESKIHKKGHAQQSGALNFPTYEEYSNFGLGYKPKNG